MLKSILIKIISHQAKRFFKRHSKIKLIVVTGSVGKTSTKLAIATLLKQRYRVLAHSGNHNTHFSVPLALLDVAYPEKHNSIFSWLRVILQMQKRVWQKSNYDIVVQELGTDQPGDIRKFSYLRPEIAVVTAVSPEHMEFFKTIDAVAAEELAVCEFSHQTIVNQDDIEPKFLEAANNSAGFTTYGLSTTADYNFIIMSQDTNGITGALNGAEFGQLSVILTAVGEPAAKAVTAATAVAAKLSLTAKQISDGIAQIQPVPGRMQLLRGLNDSTIIDDTYNSSPLALEVAIKTITNFPATQRIAILGSMNELGELSESAHQAAGALCDPTKLDWVITVGQDARRYLATEAAAQGCQVRSFNSPYDAGSFAHSVLKPGAVILAKGSQNGVFTEEALKILLHNTEDEAKLVRQSKAWMAKKQAQFKNQNINYSVI